MQRAERPEPPVDHFPATLYTWIGRRLEQGTPGRDELNHHVMKVYARPLQIYLRRHSMRWLGEPEELVAGFFRDRLARTDFLREWLHSSKRLRHWLINALNYFLLEEAKRRKRDGRVKEIPENFLAEYEGPGAEEKMDRDFTVAVVQNALDIARQMCVEKDLTRHWEIFLLRYYDGCSYRDFVERFGIDEARAAVMARTAKNKFVAALREQLERDGVAPENIDREIQLLLESDGD